MLRITTTSVLKSYRTHLMDSTIKRNDASTTVLTQRKFQSYADDPAAATQAFQLRRSYMRTDAQKTINESVIRKYESAYDAIDSVVALVDNEKATSSWAAVLRAKNDATGAGRTALGVNLEQLSENIVQTMNVQYGDDFIFAGADGLNVPFEWQNDELYYRGICVEGKTQADMDKLDYLETEARYMDIGLGLEETAGGELVEASAFDSSIPGIHILGYGTDGDGDPKNIVSIIRRMGEILQNCDENSGAWASDAEKEEFARLAGKFEMSAAELKKRHVDLSTEASFLKDNLEILETNSYTLNEQIVEIENVELADAITAYSWAQYCYNAALKVGNSVLSESLMDYMRY